MLNSVNGDLKQLGQQGGGQGGNELRGTISSKSPASSIVDSWMQVYPHRSWHGTDEPRQARVALQHTEPC
eukprot:scaffold75669_cov51-Phaeocystis_antarctica.AAC.2